MGPGPPTESVCEGVLNFFMDSGFSINGFNCPKKKKRKNKATKYSKVHCICFSKKKKKLLHLA